MASEGVYTATPLELVLGTFATSAQAVATTASAGTAKTVSRGDHKHSIALATGDSNGQVKIAGTNVSVKGLGTAAYTASTAYAASSHTHSYLPLSGGTLTGNLIISRAGEAYVRCLNTNTGASVYLDSDGTNHGVWSAGKWDGSTFTSSGKWLIHRTTSDTANCGLSFTAAGSITASSGQLYATANSNTVRIGSQNSSWCHIYNSASVPFIFNNSVCTTQGGLGTATYKWGVSYFGDEIKSYLANAFRACYGNYGVIFRNDGGSFYFLLTDSGSAATGSWNSLRPFYFSLSTGVVTCGNGVKGAVWNDYAECRYSKIEEPGRVIASNGKDELVLTTKRLQPAAHIISDTYGFSVGDSDRSKVPIGVSGRVLVYPYKDRKKYKVGDCLCAAPGGTADIMSRSEIIMYPDRIIGIVDEVPDYEIWEQKLTQENDMGAITKTVEIKGRIWCYVR